MLQCHNSKNEGIENNMVVDNIFFIYNVTRDVISQFEEFG